MSVADIICSRKWASRGAGSNSDTAKNRYYPSFPIVFTAKKHPFLIPSVAVSYSDPKDPAKKIPINTTPIDMTCVTLKISPAPKPDGAYDFEYATNLMAAKFYEYGDYLVSSPILARQAMVAPPNMPKAGKKTKKTDDTSLNLLPALYVTHVISAIPAMGKYAMFMRSYWSDGTLGGYWCCE